MLFDSDIWLSIVFAISDADSYSFNWTTISLPPKERKEGFLSPLPQSANKRWKWTDYGAVAT
jgi:hypothetical protein